MATIVKCPTCQKEVIWGPGSAFRPFCSDRCRLIDLGAWANEEHKIPDKGRADQPLSEQQLEQLENELLEQDNEFFK
ncbi:hypothetical protein Rhein_2849, partial [Rheinheimera sp. A13L]|uniref:DNA gyrase inhibitor YacG n=1 Tax=Rheinheimera sp. A13L TaxID=506534 RepID=UPI0002124EE6